MHIVSLILTLVAGIILFFFGMGDMSLFFSMGGDYATLELMQQNVNHQIEMHDIYSSAAYGLIITIVALLGMIGGYQAFQKKQKGWRLLAWISFLSGIAIFVLYFQYDVLYAHFFSYTYAIEISVLYGICSFFAWLAVRKKRMSTQEVKADPDLSASQDS